MIFSGVYGLSRGLGCAVCRLRHHQQQPRRLVVSKIRLVGSGTRAAVGSNSKLSNAKRGRKPPPRLKVTSASVKGIVLSTPRNPPVKEGSGMPVAERLPSKL